MNDGYKIGLKPAILIWLIFGSVFAAGQARAGTSSKTFDFGAGGDNPTSRSHSRSFAAPEAVVIVVAVNYRTNGDEAIPIIVEIEDAANQILVSREVAAEKPTKRFVVNIAAVENKIHGCEKFWQIRVRTKNGEIPTARVSGNITFSFVDPTATQIETEEKSFNLAKGRQAIKNIGDNESSRHPGVFQIRASWLHSLINLVLPIKFELVRPDGSVAKTLVGYAVNSNGRPPLDFSHNLTVSESKQTGVWKLRITNETEHDIIEIKPAISFTKKCFE